MKKLTALLMTTVFFSHYGFAESTVSGSATPPPTTNNGFDITSTTSGAQTISAPAPKQAVTINEDMEVVTATKHEEDATLPYTIDYSYPQISGDNLTKSAENFNNLVVDLVNKSVRQFKNYVKADMPHMQTLPESAKHNTFLLNYKIDVIKPGKDTILSVRLSIEGMQAGRAHPYHTHQVLNYDLNKGKVLALKDLFKPRANYLNLFAKYSGVELNKKLQDKWMIKEGTAPLPKNYQQWNLNDKGILITFDEYQVAPYVAGAQEVEIPYSALKNVIAHDAPIAAFK